MLSVLIPTYRWNALPLIEELHQQLVAEKIQFEIVVIDDASHDASVIHNQKINSLNNSSFQVLETNIGRSAIRNLLAKKAKHPWLLFLDADVRVCENTFIKSYTTLFSNTSTVLIGGLNYTRDTAQKSLRRNFGIHREVVSEKIRNEEPYRYFFASNFVVKKDVFDIVSFDETIKGYGYEDLLFATKLKEKGVFVKHIDNPVYHLGIDANKDFISKTKEALLNLSELVKTNSLLIEEVKLVSIVRKYKFLLSFLAPFQTLFKRYAIKKSSLFFFDLFRVTYLCKLLKKSQ